MSDQPKSPQFKYRAFLSYRNADARQAAWLHKTLEEYVVPRALVGTLGEHGVVPKRLGRIFRDRDEARSAEDIETVISHELSQSEHLIVLCTPNAVAPHSWMAREIELFRVRRPDGGIHAVIGAGVPPACFPRPLVRTTSDGRTEAPLAADLRSTSEGGPDGLRKGVVRLIAGLLGVQFDDLWRREERRRRARRLVLAVELCGAAVAALLLIMLGNFYRSHAVVEMDLSALSSIADNVRVVGSEEAPENNGVRVFTENGVSSGSAWLWVPTSDVIVRVHAAYRDHAERAISVHLMLTEGFDPDDKWLRFTMPTAEQIVGHPGMAYIPTSTWFHGRENEPRSNTAPFWIDLRPPTVADYVQVAEGLMKRGQLEPDNSFILTARRQSAAVEQTGLTQLRSLNRDLGAIFGVVSAATSPTVSAPGDIVAGLVNLPCDTCPAPMTRYEAEVYCQSRRMRLPTALEWELAVRGVDGRVYPWGNRFDASRANVPGLPEKGGPSPALKPVDAYKEQLSPFGLIDTVGNAGDWVVNDIGSYERVYMGATYRYNPEDATAFRLLPITDSDYLVREITVRCVDPAR
jgi:formylglycine-generating enzyme required for sulfatase activity